MISIEQNISISDLETFLLDIKLANKIYGKRSEDIIKLINKKIREYQISQAELSKRSK